MLIESHLNRVAGKLDSLVKIYAVLAYKKVGELEDVGYFETMEHHRTPPDGAPMKPAIPGTAWGSTLGTAWFCAALRMKKEWAGKRIFLHADTGAPETLLFVDGKPLGILTQTDNPLNYRHYALPIALCAEQEKNYTVAAECYAGAPFQGCAPYEYYDPDLTKIYSHTHTFQSIDVVEQRSDIFDFAVELLILLQLYRRTADSFVKAEAMRCIEQVNRTVCEYPCESDESDWRPKLAEAREVMRGVLGRQGGGHGPTVSLVGHSHMDTAWLWPVRETMRKCARTYANALTMMEMFPDYTFTQSSSLHTDWMREYYPDIFEGIKRRVAEGRYECNGGVWVECDCNITGGEAMVRQFLYGQKFTAEQFGKKSDCFWLPDTFGYNGNIPQIMLGCDVRYFMTTKISWNETNPFPMDTFYWKGIDGSAVLTNFNAIGCPADPDRIIDRAASIKDKRVSDRTLLAYGFGDGGGGPDTEMITIAEKLSDVAGMPRTRHTTVSGYLKELEASLVDAPVYEGELYLEIHRGTLTSKHQIKRNNRKAEIALRELELLNAMAMAAGKAGREQRIEPLYKVLLKNQFHDILPGSSIMEVHSLAEKEVGSLIEEVRSVGADYAGLLTESGPDLTVFNTLSWARGSQFTVDGADIAGIGGAYTQTYTDIRGREKTAVGGVTLPPLSEVTLKKGTPKSGDSPFRYDGTALETPFARMEFDENGYIASFFHKAAKRQLVRDRAVPFNALLCAEDVPRSWDNWDVDGDLETKFQIQRGFESREVVSDGPLQIRLRSAWKIGAHSRLVQDMVCYSDSERVDFETVMYWEDRHVFLKTAFDADLRVSEVKNEIQYGYISRPTTRNNTIESAKFEICNHKWSDLSENRFGVAVLNDCKYGLSAKGSGIFLSLHKSGIKPDYTGDSGVHEVTYSLLPHNCGYSVPAVTMPAYELNCPVPAVKGVAVIPEAPLFTVDSDHVIIESVKPSEDGRGIAVRLYEAEKSAAAARLKPGFAFASAELTNMLEEKIADLPVTDGAAELSFRAFEIKTVLFRL